jgi:hypothetical protein
MAHALLMLYLFTRRVGSLKPYRVGRTTAISLVASAAMVLPMSALLQRLQPFVPVGSLGYLLRIVAATGCGGMIYLLLLRLFGVEEIALIRRALHRQSLRESLP